MSGKNEIATGKHSPTFCVLPWLHIHMWPDSQVFPCCAADNQLPIGTYSGQSAKEVFNLPKLKEVRRKMLNGEHCRECTRCYKQEEITPNDSHRIGSNKRFSKFIDESVARTLPDGTLSNPKLRFLDIRFSNLCNFKCRTCGPDLSSRWYDDYNKYAEIKGYEPRQRKIIQAHSTDQLIADNIQDITHIYFAGGEPLIIDEHLSLLKTLVEKGSPDNIHLMYNTNFSTLKHRDTDFIEIWKKFKKVDIWFSVDAPHRIGEYLRHGFKWERFLQNARRLRDEAPEIHRTASATISIFSVLDMPKLHKILWEEKLIGTYDFRINMLFDPHYFRIDRMPREMQREVVKRFIDHATGFCREINTPAIADMFLAAARYVNDSEGTNEQILETWTEVKQLDKIRNEQIEVAQPEIAKFYKDALTLLPKAESENSASNTTNDQPLPEELFEAPPASNHLSDFRASPSE